MVKDPVPLGEVRRALVVKLRHHGDVLLSSPVFSVLKAHAPLRSTPLIFNNDQMKICFTSVVPSA